MTLISDRVVTILPGEKLPPARVKGSTIKKTMVALDPPMMNAVEVARISPPLSIWYTSLLRL